MKYEQTLNSGICFDGLSMIGLGLDPFVLSKDSDALAQTWTKRDS